MRDHKKLYGIYIRSSMLASLIITALAFQFVPNIEVKSYEGSIKPEDRILSPDIFPPTDEPEPPPPKEKPLPKVVVPGDDDSDNDITMKGDSDFDQLNLIHGDIINLQKPIRYALVEKKPQPLNTPPPEYPEILIKAGIEGDCVLWGVIDTTGRITQAKVYHSSSNPLFDKAALEAFKNYQFSPGYQHDRPVPVEITMPFKFKLK